MSFERLHMCLYGRAQHVFEDDRLRLRFKDQVLASLVTGS